MHYYDGQEVRLSDIVRVRPARLARVSLILRPHTKVAAAYSCPEGGFVLEFDDGDCQACSEADVEIELVKRGS